jgi:RHH-type transcriptional regulator, rel operon repressor / antitoxin RelB
VTDSAILHVRPELVTGLDELAKASGRSREELAEEALAEYLEVQRWQIAGIEEAVRAADAGELGIPHEDVAAWLDSWGTDDELPPPEPKS